VLGPGYPFLGPPLGLCFACPCPPRRGGQGEGKGRARGLCPGPGKSKAKKKKGVCNNCCPLLPDTFFHSLNQRFWCFFLFFLLLYWLRGNQTQKNQERERQEKTKKYIPKKQTNCIFILSLSGFFFIFSFYLPALAGTWARSLVPAVGRSPIP